MWSLWSLNGPERVHFKQLRRITDEASSKDLAEERKMRPGVTRSGEVWDQAVGF